MTLDRLVQEVSHCSMGGLRSLRARSLSCLPLPWLTPLIRVQALVMGARPAHLLHFLLLRQSLPHVPSPSWCRNLGRCCLTPPGSRTEVLGRPCRRNQFLDQISNSILGSSTRASFAGRQQVASSFSQTRIAIMAKTGEMVGASFLSICVTGRRLWAAQGTQSPELRAPI